MDLKSKNYKKLIIWTSSFFPNFGGLESAVHEYYNYFSIKGWGIEVITNRNPFRLSSLEIIDGIVINRFRFFHSPSNYFINYRFDLILLWIIYKIYTIFNLLVFFNNRKPSIVNLHFPDHQLFEILVLKFIFNFKLIVSLHGNEVMRLKDFNKYSIKYLFYLVLFKKSKYITGCSKYLIKEIRNIFPNIKENKFKVIYNGVKKIYHSENKNVAKNDFIFSAMRIVPSKGIDLLIDSLELLKFKNGLYLAGGEKSEILDFLSRKKINLEIKYLGKLKSESMSSYLNTTMLTIIPSKEESFCIFLAEALCSGSPVVTTNVGGIPEVIFLAKKHLNHHQRKIFDLFVKVSEPDKFSISKSIKKVIENRNNIDDFLALVPEIRKSFLWEQNLNNLYNLL